MAVVRSTPEATAAARSRACRSPESASAAASRSLARLAGLLKPTLEIMWVDDVRRMNKSLHADVPDVAGHLFGRERAALDKIRAPFKDAFGPHCFYCDAHLPTGNPIDHVLPWSLAGIDGLANLVLSWT